MKRFLSICVLSVMFLWCAVHGQIPQTDSSKINPAESEYEKWVKSYKLVSDRPRFSANETPPKLIMMVVTETKPETGDKQSFFLEYGTFSSGAEVSTEGKVEYFSDGPTGSKVGCCSQIEKNELERVNQLLANLPDDHSRLPPNERRLVLQIAAADKYDVRVYDLANAPDAVLELLRLTKSRIRSRVLRFNPETQWRASEYSVDAGLAVTSDGQQIISWRVNEPVKIWDSDSHTLIREAGKPLNASFNGLILSPDDSTAVIERWGEIGLVDTRTWQNSMVIEEPFIDDKRHGLSNPQFIKNGKFLLVESSEPALHIYETKTRKRLKWLPEIPRGAISYYPAPSGSCAIYQPPDGQIILRDTRSQQNIAVLDKSKIKYVAFSPDESLVAVVTFHSGTGNKEARYRIRIWEAESGNFVKELLPFEQDICESVEGLMWSPDGRYILGGNQAYPVNTSRGISIWNVETGRHRGELSGCPTKLTGLGFLRGKSKVVAGCGDGVIRIWDLADALTKIDKFEELLTEK